MISNNLQITSINLQVRIDLLKNNKETMYRYHRVYYTILWTYMYFHIILGILRAPTHTRTILGMYNHMNRKEQNVSPQKKPYHNIGPEDNYYLLLFFLLLYF